MMMAAARLNLPAVFLYGGTGSNSLTTNAATRSGIRTLRWFQFQTVNNI